MKKTNVTCMHCGKEEYNPNIPLAHNIDCCSDQKCIDKALGNSIGFKDGTTVNCSVSNLYPVNPNYLRIEQHQTVSNDTTDTLAMAKYHISQQEYGLASSLLRLKEIKGLPEAKYLNSKIFFKKQNNTAMGVKLLKESSDLDYPLAMAEYGYIITMGKYGKTSDPDKGIQLLLEAYDAGAVVASNYLVDVYKSGPKESVGYKSISDDRWFEVASYCVRYNTNYTSELILGYFYYLGIGTKVDFDLAYKHLLGSSSKDCVVAQSYLVNLIMDPSSGLLDNHTVLVAFHYCAEYLTNASHKDIAEYKHMEDMYDEILIAMTLFESEVD